MASSNLPSETIFSHFWKFSFKKKKMLSHKREKSYFFKKSNKIVPFKLIHQATREEPVQNGFHD